MPERLNQRQLLLFLGVLVGLLILAYVLLTRLLPSPSSSLPPPPPSALAVPSPSSSLPTPNPTLAPALVSQCREQVKPFLAQIDPLVSEWVDELKQAGRAPLGDLPGEIDKLRSVRQRVHALQVPVCAEGAFLNLLDSMDRSIAAYQGFVAQLPEDQIRSELAQASELLARYVEQIDRLR